MALSPVLTLLTLCAILLRVIVATNHFKYGCFPTDVQHVCGSYAYSNKSECVRCDKTKVINVTDSTLVDITCPNSQEILNVTGVTYYVETNWQAFHSYCFNLSHFDMRTCATASDVFSCCLGSSYFDEHQLTPIIFVPEWNCSSNNCTVSVNKNSFKQIMCSSCHINLFRIEYECVVEGFGSDDCISVEEKVVLILIGIIFAIMLVLILLIIRNRHKLRPKYGDSETSPPGIKKKTEYELLSSEKTEVFEPESGLEKYRETFQPIEEPQVTPIQEPHTAVSGMKKHQWAVQPNEESEATTSGIKEHQHTVQPIVHVEPQTTLCGTKKYQEALKLMYADIISSLSPDRLLPYLFSSDLITQSDNQRIRRTLNNEGPTEASKDILEIVQRYSELNQFEKFLELLKENGHKELSEKIKCYYEGSNSATMKKKMEPESPSTTIQKKKETSFSSPQGSAKSVQEKIDSRCDSIDKDISNLDQDLLKYKGQMKKMGDGPAKKNLMQKIQRLLSKKKRKEKQQENLTQQSFNLEQTDSAIQTLKDTKATVVAMEVGAKQFKKENKDINIKKIDDLHDKREEQIEQAEDIQEVMGRSCEIPDDLQDELEYINE